MVNCDQIVPKRQVSINIVLKKPSGFVIRWDSNNLEGMYEPNAHHENVTFVSNFTFTFSWQDYLEITGQKFSQGPMLWNFLRP